MDNKSASRPQRATGTSIVAGSMPSLPMRTDSCTPETSREIARKQTYARGQVAAGQQRMRSFHERKRPVITVPGGAMPTSALRAGDRPLGIPIIAPDRCPSGSVARRERLMHKEAAKATAKDPEARVKPLSAKETDSNGLLVSLNGGRSGHSTA